MANLTENDIESRRDRCGWCKMEFDGFCAKAKKFMTYDEFWKPPFKPKWCPGIEKSETFHT